MSSIQNQQTYQDHKPNTNIRKSINSNIELSRNDSGKFEKSMMHGKPEHQNFGYFEDTDSIKKSHSYSSRMSGNGMNSMNGSNFKKTMAGHESPKYKSNIRKGIPNNGNKPNPFTNYSPKYQNPMKPLRNSPPNEKSFEHNIQPHQGPMFNSPRRIQTIPNNNRPNRQSTSPNQFSPTQRSYQFNYHNNRYPQPSYQENMQAIPQISPRGGNINTIPMNPIPMQGPYIPISKPSINYKSSAVPIQSPIKKKSSAIDIVDPETNEKRNFEKPKKSPIEAKTGLTEIKKHVEISSSGTETPVNEVTDTNNTSMEGSQMVESDATETVFESSDLEEEQINVKTEVIPAVVEKKEEQNTTEETKVVVVEEVQEEKKIVEKEEKIVEIKKEEIVEKIEIVEKSSIQKEEKNEKTLLNFEDILYPENTEIPSVSNGIYIYTAAFLMLFKQVCNKAPSDLYCPPLGSSNSKEEKSKNKNSSRGSKNSKNYHQGGNGGNSAFEHNNSKSNHSQNKNMGNRSMSGSSRRGNVGRSFSRRQQQQQQDLPPVTPLQKSENAWMRAKQVNLEEAEEEEKREIIFRKVKGILNKLTLEKFELLGNQVINIGIDDEIILHGIIKLIFDKAIDEPNFGSLYAKLCQYINEELPKIKSWVRIDEKKNNAFRRLMLNRCQEEFEKNIKWSEDINDDKPVSQMTDEEKLDYSRKLSERTKKKRRSLGNIRFIGELYMYQMITENIIHICFMSLLNNLGNPDEESVECLCFLLETVGAKIEKQAKSKAKNGIKMAEWNEYFRKIDELSKNKEIPSRMRFMLMDIIELRKNKWKSRINEAGPKTIAEIHKEAERELKEQEMKRNSNRSSSGRSSSSRSMDHRGSRRGDSMILRSNQNKLDNSELNKFGKFESNNKQFSLAPGGGSGSRFNFGAKSKAGSSRSSTVVNTPSPLSPHSNMFDALNDEEKNSEMVAEPVEDKTLTEKKIPKMDKEKAKARIENTYDEYMNQKDMNEAIENIKEIGTDSYNRNIIEIFISKFFDRKQNDIEVACGLIVKFYKEKLITTKDIEDEIEDQAEFIEDALYEAPNVYDFYGLLLANCINAEALTFKSLQKICDLMKNASDIKKTGIPAPARLLSSTLVHLKKLMDENTFVKNWTNFKTSLKYFWYEKYDVEKMVNWVINNKLECIYPIALNFKELINKVGKEPSEEILKYIHSSIDEFTQDSSDFINGLIQISINNMNKNELSNEEKTKYIEGLKEFIQPYIKGKQIQSEVLSSIEEVCKKSEEDLVLIIQTFINQEIIEKNILMEYIDKSCKASEKSKSILKEL